MADTASSSRTTTTAHVHVAVASSSDAETLATSIPASADDAITTGDVVLIDSTAITTTVEAAMANLRVAYAPLNTSASVATSAAATANAAQVSVAADFMSALSVTDKPKSQPTLSELLVSAAALVEKMAEAKYMCNHVLERITAVSGSNPPIQDNDMERLLKIAGEFVVFMTKFADEPIGLYRLVHCRTVVAHLESFHHDLDYLVRDANEPTNEWETRFTACRSGMNTQFMTMSLKRTSLFGKGERTVEQQCNALPLVMYELKYAQAANLTDELNVLTSTRNTLLQFSSAMLLTVYAWFLPPYEIKLDAQPFSFGSFADVYMATFLGTRVVVKVPKPASVSVGIDAFVNEAEAWFVANRIPNVMRFLGACHIEGQRYYVSEFAANGTLSNFVMTSEQGAGMVWQLLLQAAYGLKGIHQFGLFHNDLKCTNILVTDNFTAKLTDFGMSSFSSAETALGAIPWKAPERIKDSKAYAQAQEALKAGKVTMSALAQASDVYSFGMCIYEAVSQRKPWGSAEDVVVKRKLDNGELPAKPERFSDDQWTLVKDMCAFEPMHRMRMDSVIGRLTTFANDEIKMQQREFTSETAPSLLAATQLC